MATIIKNIIKGDDQANVILGSSEIDIIHAGAGNDTISGDHGDDTIDGQAGNDNISGGGGNDTLLGDAGADLLNGGAGVDRLFGGFGRDKLMGGLDGDELNGEHGADMLYGGAGADIYYLTDSEAVTDTLVFNLDDVSVGSIDLVYGFTKREDKIDLRELGFTKEVVLSGLTTGVGPVTHFSSILRIDVNNDKAVDIAVELLGNEFLGISDFVF